MKISPVITSTKCWPFWVLLCLHSQPVRSQVDNGDLGRRIISPAGYTGVINTPTAHVQGWGVAGLAWSHNNPEYARTISQGSFGSINAAVGLLPGLEAVGRLSYEGDLNCNLYKSNCAAGSRDLSLSTKYQLPLNLGPHTRVAVGVTDFGGAATNFRQAYGVATTQWQNTEFSLGYSRASSSRALMDGPFGSVRYAFSPDWQLLAEHDTQQIRAGLQYHIALGDRAALLAGYSRKFSRNTDQEANQLQLSWVIHMDRSTPRPLSASSTTALAAYSATTTSTHSTTRTTTSATNSANPSANVYSAASPQTPPGKPAPTPTPTKVEPATANDLAQALQAIGFANVQVSYWPATAQQNGLWHITAEPRAYRQSQIEALGRAMAPWLEGVRQNRIQRSDQVQWTLTYQRQPVLHAMGQADCLVQWAQGAPCAANATPLTISRNPLAAAATAPRADAAPVQSAQASAGASWAPQITLSPALRNTLGTEYGLFDYSLAAQIGAEIALAPGLFWQGIYMVPVSNSDDYKPGKVFSDASYAKNQWHSSQLTYWKPLALGVSAQASVGQLAPGQTGGQWDAIWMSGDGRTRLGLTGGRYRSDQRSRDQLPLFAQARYTIIPGAWHAEVTGGQFMNGDRGLKIASVHWAGDTRLALQFQKTGDSDQPTMPSRSLLSFNVSFPFGPKTATPVGPVWLRAQDQWGWGVQTKVGDNDNYLTQGYGEMPRQRQGLWSDVTDHDRNGAADLQAQMPRLKAILATP